MLPLTVGFLSAGPLSGAPSDRFGARPFATGGMFGAALTFTLLELLPIDFPYWAFAGILLLSGLSMGCFASPNRAAVMNSLRIAVRGGRTGFLDAGCGSRADGGSLTRAGDGAAGHGRVQSVQRVTGRYPMRR